MADVEGKKVIDPQVEAAAEVAGEMEKEGVGDSGADQILETTAAADEAEAEAIPAAEAVPHAVSPEVAEVVTPHHETDRAQKVLDAHPEGNVTPVGETIPKPTGSNIINFELKATSSAFDTPRAKAVKHNPTDSNADSQLAEERKGWINWVKERLGTQKILGGTKVAEQTPSSTPQLPQQTQESVQTQPAPEQKQAA